MKKLIIVSQIILLTIFLLPVGSVKAAPLINLGTAPTTVAKYEKFEVPFTISGVDYTAINPFNPNLSGTGSTYAYQKPGIKVDGYFHKTDSSDWIVQPAFYDGDGNWKVRFAPKEVGNWEFKIKANLSTDFNETTAKPFTVTDSANHGFLKVNASDPRYFQFEDGTSFTPIGTAISGISVNRLTAIDSLKAHGINYSRVFLNTPTQIEIMGTEATAGKCADINNYSLTRTANFDAILEHAEQAGVYVQWVQEDWEKIKDREINTQNAYVACGSDVASNVSEFFSKDSAKEIYKRKLRYIAARWGYSTNLMAIELVNELGGASGDKAWHIEMADYYHNITPYSKHMITSSNGSEELRLGGGIPWNQPQIDFVNYHSYGKCTNPWDYNKFDTKLEKMGSTEGRPWFDTAVWADRIVRAYRGNTWPDKPLIWNEFGLGMSDWDNLYIADTTGQHLRDAVWASTLTGFTINHWKYDYVAGAGEYAPTKMTIFDSLSNYLKGANFEGMKQETTYPVEDLNNPSPNITSTNSNVAVYAMNGSDKSYFYVKNATTPFIQVKLDEITACTSNFVPAAEDQSGEVIIKNLTPGTYSLTKWSTTEPDPAKQILETKDVIVGADGIATVAVALGKTVGTNDYAYKLLNKGSIKITSSPDKASVVLNDQFNITNKVTNTTQATASELTVTNVIPFGTNYVSSTENGVSAPKEIACDKATEYNWPACPAGSTTFTVTAVTWSGISVPSGSSKDLGITLKYVGNVTPPPPDDTFIKLSGATPLTIEAEDPKVALSGSMTITDDASASEGKYIGTANGVGNGSGSATFKVDATDQPGTYYLSALTNWLDTSGNSFSVSLDGSPSVVLGNDTHYNIWQWVKLTDTANPKGIPMNLTGQHTIRLINREDGAKLDQIGLTTNIDYNFSGGTPPPPPPPTDTQAPTVEITSPSSGATFRRKGTKTIAVTATDNVGTTKVEIFIDGVLKTTDSSSPYTYSWNLREYSAGIHTITAKGYDAAGNIGQAQISVKLK